MAKGLGYNQKKILLLLVAGVSLAFAYTSGQRRRVWRELGREFEKINQAALRRSIEKLYQSKLIDYRETKNGVVQIVVSEDGKKKALTYKVDEMKISIPKKWDKKWRLVVFDIPKNLNKARDILRFQLKYLGFYKLQKSIFVFPYDCRDEIEFLVELYDIRPFVRYAVVDFIDNDLHLRDIFDRILKR